jgi:hypothetical protein
MTNQPAQAALVRAAASFVRDTYSGEWADDAAATLETDADLIERGEPCSLLRLAEAMQPAAVSAAVTPPTQTALRDWIRRAICEAEGFAWDTDMLEPDEYGEVADAVLAVLYREWPWLRAEAEDAAPPADQATVYREAADALGRMDYDTDSNDYGYDTYRDAWNGGVMDAADRLRRLADEAQQQERSDVGTPEDRCAECGHFQGAHEEAEEPVSVGRCTVCADDDAWHNYEATEEERRLAGARRQPAAAPEPEPPVHGESVAHLAGDHDGHDQWADDEQDDTLPAWLYQRFMVSGVGWDNLDEDDRSYWEHHARAVRRAVARGGFKQPAVDARQDGARQ